MHVDDQQRHQLCLSERASASKATQQGQETARSAEASGLADSHTLQELIRGVP